MPSLPTTPTDAPTRLVFGDCELDLAAQRLHRAGLPVALPPRYFAVLVHLAGSGGRLVSKGELLDAVWGHRHVSDSVIKVAINAVRQALGDDPKAPRHLETVARRGYRFIGLQAAPAPQPVEAPPLRGNLPAPQPGLIGREADQQRLQQALAEHRLVTLLGPGGVGKTRLALAVAAHGAPADGVWLLRLDALAVEGPLLATLARTLGLGAAAQGSAEALARALAGLQLRLLLDNAEHLQPAVAALAAALLASAPGVQLLVTSQVPLRVAGEHRFSLAPLALTAPAAGGDEPAAAVQLLLARGRQLQADLPFDAAAAADATAIARVLDGLPLALELAAARLPLLGWAGVRERLGAGLGLLTRGAHDAAERHRTLRAALSWTCGLLAPGELQVLQALSVLAGPFTVDDAIAVAGPDDAAAVLDALDSLRERSLLVHASDAAAPRWRLYDSVRAFAAEGLAAGAMADEVRRRLVMRQIAVFRQADEDHAHKPLRAWLLPLQPEADNLRAALRIAFDDPALRTAGVALFNASAGFRVRGGWRREALRDFNTVTSWSDWQPSADEQAGLDLAQGLLSVLGQVLPPQPALLAARRAEAFYQARADGRRLHLALYVQAGLLVRLQAPVAERAALLARMRALEGPGLGPMQRRLRAWQDVMLLRDQGDLAAFEAQCAAYMASGRALGDETAAWSAAQALAQAMCSQDRLPTALALLERAVGEMRACGELRENAHVLAQWAALRVVHDAEPASQALLREAAQLMHADDRLWWMADALAWLPLWQGRIDDAARVQAWADDLVRQRGDLRGLLFRTVRGRFEQALAARPDAKRCQTLLAAPPGWDETTVLATVFGTWPPEINEESISFR